MPDSGPGSASSGAPRAEISDRDGTAGDSPGHGSTSLVESAAALAAHLLQGDTERLEHSAAVARRAEVLAATVAPEDRASLVSAAWLHDIGYSLAIQQTGFHPVDGARYLRSHHWPTLIQNLVAHHSGSRFVGTARKLEPMLAEFDFEEDALSDALTTADQTVGPGGRAMTVEERMADMLRRHGPDSPNGRAHLYRQPYLVGAAHRVAARLNERGMSPRQHRILLDDPH